MLQQSALYVEVVVGRGWSREEAHLFQGLDKVFYALTLRGAQQVEELLFHFFSVHSCSDYSFFVPAKVRLLCEL